MSEYLGRGVVASVGVGQFTGRQLQGLFLVEYDQSSDSYVGVSFPHSEEFTQLLHSAGKGQFTPDQPANLGVVVRISGLRRYPCTDRPNYAFQFVLPGENPDPLREIMAANAEGQYTAGEPPSAPVTDQPSEQGANFDPADANQDGTVTKAERKQYKNK